MRQRSLYQPEPLETQDLELDPRKLETDEQVRRTVKDALAELELPRDCEDTVKIPRLEPR
jgi:hypothetical protein